MDKFSRSAFLYAAIVTIGGFVFGLDAALISGTLRYVAIEFALDDMQLGTVVSAPALGVLLALVITGVICDAIGRKKTLIVIAFLYTISAFLSAVAPSYEALVGARFIGGLAFTSLSLASMYIGEIAPAKQRGKLVAMNQIMIVVGLTAAYFSNYYLQSMAQQPDSLAAHLISSNDLWRWMLGIEIVPAVIWFILLFFIPESPRWLLAKDHTERAKRTMSKLMNSQEVSQCLAEVEENLRQDQQQKSGIGSQFRALFDKKFRMPLLIGVIFAAVQPLTGVNPILFYAPMVIEQTGIGTNAAFAQSLIIGIVSFIFTALAMVFVDKLGRRPLVNGGLFASVICLMICVIAFSNASYQLTAANIEQLTMIPELAQLNFSPILDKTFNSDIEFKQALQAIMPQQTFRAVESNVMQLAVDINATLVLVGIVGFIAAFHISIGPIMWVVFSEIVPTLIRGIAIPMFALLTSTVSYFMQKFFPWQLSNMGAADIFLSYAIASMVGLVLLYRYLPETRHKSIEEVEAMLCAEQSQSTRG